MTKKDKKTILKAMKLIHPDDYIDPQYSCNALSSVLNDWEDLELIRRYEQFIEPSENSDGHGWFGTNQDIENQNTRLTALALFMVAEEDTL